MNCADNWARVFVVIMFLTFVEAQIIGGIVPNLITLGEMNPLHPSPLLEIDCNYINLRVLSFDDE